MMKKKVVVLGSVLALLLGACLPFSLTPGTGPTVDTLGTVDAVNSAVAQTLAAQPTLTSAPLTDTPTPVLASPEPATTETPTETLSPVPNLTTTPVTATLGTLDQAFTATLASGQATLIPTLTIRKYGTLPPEVPSSRVRLINKAKTEAYISLQVTMLDGRYSIIEYPVERSVTIQAPIGFYIYVAWVGGRKMVGDFRLYRDQSLVITLFRDKVVVE
jgi:hypothetical protein